MIAVTLPLCVRIQIECVHVYVDVLQFHLHTAPLTRHRVVFCPPLLQTHGSYVLLSVLTHCVVELQTRSIFSLVCMEVRRQHERAVLHAEKRAALHRPLTLDV